MSKSYKNKILRNAGSNCLFIGAQSNVGSYLSAMDAGCLTVMYDSELLGKIFMPIDCEKREDHGAWLDITRKGIKAHRLNECLSIYRMGEKTVSSNKAKMLKYQYRLYRRHEKFGVLKSLWYVMLCSFHKIFNKY